MLKVSENGKIGENIVLTGKIGFRLMKYSLEPLKCKYMDKSYKHVKG